MTQLSTFLLNKYGMVFKRCDLQSLQQLVSINLGMIPNEIKPLNLRDFATHVPAKFQAQVGVSNTKDYKN
jgi:hypothetical protein